MILHCILAAFRNFCDKYSAQRGCRYKKKSSCAHECVFAHFFLYSWFVGNDALKILTLFLKSGDYICFSLLLLPYGCGLIAICSLLACLLNSIVSFVYPFASGAKIKIELDLSAFLFFTYACTCILLLDRVFCVF